MRYFYVKSAELVPKPSEQMRIDQLVPAAISFAKQGPKEYAGATVRFEYEYVHIEVNGNSDPELIKRDWWRAVFQCVVPDIGPRSRAELSAEELDRDELVRSAAKLVVDDYPGFLVDKERWEGLRSLYYPLPIKHAAFDYAERWGVAMQQVMPTSGLDLRRSAIIRAAYKAGVPTLGSLTGRMIILEAIQLLKECWAHKDEPEFASIPTHGDELTDLIRRAVKPSF